MKLDSIFLFRLKLHSTVSWTIRVGPRRKVEAIPLRSPDTASTRTFNVKKEELVPGFEPGTYRLQIGCAAELRHTSLLPLDSTGVGGRHPSAAKGPANSWRRLLRTLGYFCRQRVPEGVSSSSIPNSPNRVRTKSASS